MTRRTTKKVAKRTTKKTVTKKQASFEGCLELQISDIKQSRNHSRVRSKVDPEMAQLMRSIKQHGLLEPIGVIAKGKGYEVAYGNRRFEACSKLGLTKVKCVLHDVGEKGRVVLNIVENVHRSETNAYSKGRAYSELVRQGLTHEEIAARCNVSKASVKADIACFNVTPKDVADAMVRAPGQKRGGSGRKGTIPEHTIKQFVNQSSHFKRVTKAKLAEAMRESVKRPEITAAHTKVVLGLIDNGKTPKQAVSNATKFTLIRPEVLVSDKEKNRLEKKYKKRLGDILRDIISGNIRDKVTS